jgi:hypothetical protein
VREELLSSLDATLLQTIGALEEMSRAPRQSPDSNSGPVTTVTLPDGRSITVPTVGFPPGAFTEIKRIEGLSGGRGRAARDSMATAAAAAKTPTAPKKPPV